MHSFTQLWLIWKTSIKTKSLNTKLCPAGSSSRIICQVSPFFTKMSQNCYTHQVWTVPPSAKPLWITLAMGKNSTQQLKVYSFPLSQKSPLIDLNLSVSKVSFFLIKQRFSINHHMQSSFIAVISVVSYFKIQALCTHILKFVL